MRHPRLLTIVTLSLLALALCTAHADKKGRKVDLFWSAPDSSRFALQSVAMLPVVTYDRNLEAARLVEGSWGQSARNKGYRWISAVTVRDLVKRSSDGDSLLKSITEAILKTPRLDSLTAPALCQRLRASAVLSFRVDNWEQQQPEWNQAGKPSTTIQLKAALVDSSGRLLWSAAGSETAEGPYQDPSTNPLGVKSSGLGSQPLTGQGGAPSYVEVLSRLFARWIDQFPGRVEPRASSQ